MLEKRAVCPEDRIGLGAGGLLNIEEVLRVRGAALEVVEVMLVRMQEDNPKATLEYADASDLAQRERARAAA